MEQIARYLNRTTSIFFENSLYERHSCLVMYGYCKSEMYHSYLLDENVFHLKLHFLFQLVHIRIMLIFFNSN